MYRFWLFVCYCFLYLHLFQTRSWTGLNLYPFPITESENMSLFTFPSSCHVSSSPPQHLISCLRSPVTSFPKPHVVARCLVKPCCGAMTWPQALSVLALRLILEVRDWWHYRSLTAAHWTCSATLNDKTDQNSSQSSGHFLPVQWKRNVTWSYAEK